MIKIVIVEDEVAQQEKVKSVISKFLFKTEEEIKIEYYSKYNKSLEKEINDTTTRKIYIMDIELEGNLSGIQIAKRIRKDDWDSEIIFTTSHDKMFETVYRNIYQVFDFIEKYHDMKERLEHDLKVIFKKKFDNKMFSYSTKFIDIKVFYRSILYIYREKDERKLVIVTDNNIFKINMKLIDVFNHLDDRFKQCHRSCIINTQRVNKYEWNEGIFILDTGEEIDMLSKKYKKEVIG